MGKPTTPSLAERVEGGLLGLLIGDALGVPYEFHDAGDIPPPEHIELEPPRGFERAHPGVPPGTWSDDGAQALCLLDSLLQREALDMEHFAATLLAWFEDGAWAVDGIVFDCGLQTRQAFQALRSGTPPLASGPDGERDNGNGSLMRVLPLALWHHGDDARLALDAARQSRVTHGHLRSRLCCELYCLWARRLLTQHGDAWEDALRALRAIHVADADALRELDESILAPRATSPTGSGYVVSSLHSARQALREPSYERVVRAAIALGNDTDTTAAVAGGLAGIRHGVQSIPSRWRRALRGSELLQPLLDRLLTRLRAR